MTILIAFLIAVVALSLMMTVLVASTRPFRAYDEPIFGARASRTGAARHTGPSWLEIDRAPPPSYASHAPSAPDREIPALPISASVMPPVMPPVTPKVSETTGPRAARGSGRVNPNNWGRVRAEAGALKTATDHVRSASS